MAKEYASQVHTFVIFTADIPKDGSFHGPCPIVHHTGSHVWVGASYADELPPDVLPVGDGRDSGYDDQGCRIVSVPVRYVHAYCEDEEANSIRLCMDADEHLLACAL